MFQASEEIGLLYVICYRNISDISCIIRFDFQGYFYFRVTFICGSENHKSHDNFSFKFSISIKLSLWFWGVGFFKFSKNCNKWTAWWGLYFVILYVLEVETFLGEFSGYPRTNNYPVDTGRSYIRHRTTYI